MTKNLLCYNLLAINRIRGPLQQLQGYGTWMHWANDCGVIALQYKHIWVEFPNIGSIWYTQVLYPGTQLTKQRKSHLDNNDILLFVVTTFVWKWASQRLSESKHGMSVLFIYAYVLWRQGASQPHCPILYSRYCVSGKEIEASKPISILRAVVFYRHGDAT